MKKKRKNSYWFLWVFLVFFFFGKKKTALGLFFFPHPFFSPHFFKNCKGVFWCSLKRSGEEKGGGPPNLGNFWEKILKKISGNSFCNGPPPGKFCNPSLKKNKKIEKNGGFFFLVNLLYREKNSVNCQAFGVVAPPPPRKPGKKEKKKIPNCFWGAPPRPKTKNSRGLLLSPSVFFFFLPFPDKNELAQLPQKRFFVFLGRPCLE